MWATLIGRYKGNGMICAMRVILIGCRDTSVIYSTYNIYHHKDISTARPALAYATAVCCVVQKIYIDINYI